MSINKVILIGHLGRDPELRTFDNGGSIANASIACSEKWRDKSTGEQKEHTEWVNVVFQQRLAEIASQYLRKGSQIYVEGSLRTRKWQDKDGQDRYSTEVRVQNMQMLGRKGESSGGGRGEPRQDDRGGRRQQDDWGEPRQQQTRQQPQDDWGDDGGIPF